MAAVTQNGTAVFNVAGSKRQQFYNITGNNGQTLDVGMTNVLQVNTGAPSVITSWSAAKGTPNVGQSRITFTSTGAFTSVPVEVIGS